MVPVVPLVSAVLVSCAGMYGPPVPGPQPFPPQPQPPRFGYGGVQSPNNVPPPVVTPAPRNAASANSVGNTGSGNAAAPVRKKPPVVIKRDPNDTIVDLTPPEPPPAPPLPTPEKVEPKPAPEPDVRIEGAAVAPERKPAPTPAPTPKPVAREDLPYGIPAVTKPGCVYSPYHTTGLVDVEGFARGTKVECPYTHKFFRVP
jgi:hypothetical protein